MDSLEWRAKKLEDKILGVRSGVHSIDTTGAGQELSICDTLIQVSKVYRNFIDANEEKYARFKELYEKHQRLLKEVDAPGAQVSDIAKAELVLAYDTDLVKHLEGVQLMAEKAERVLDNSKWPDLSNFKERLDKLETITRDQHLQSVHLDQRTEELVEIYNDIITTFKNNCAIWNDKLDAYESEERKLDEDD